MLEIQGFLMTLRTNSSITCLISLCDEFAEAPKDKYGFIKNQLVRGRNRVVDALNEAGNLLE